MHITELQFCRPIDLCMHSVVATHKEYTTYGLGTSMYGEFSFGKKSPNFVSLNQQLVKNIYFCKVESFFFLKSSRSCMICRVCLVYFGFWIFGFLEENLSHLKY